MRSASAAVMTLRWYVSTHVGCFTRSAKPKPGRGSGIGIEDSVRVQDLERVGAGHAETVRDQGMEAMTLGRHKAAAQPPVGGARDPELAAGDLQHVGEPG